MSMLQHLEKDGRFAGVYASKEIKKGTLILKEVAQLTPVFEHEYDCCISCTAMLMKAYHLMSPNDQEQYLKLRNRFAGSTDQDVLDQRKEFIEGIPKSFPYRPEFVSEVTEIYMTNQCKDKGANNLPEQNLRVPINICKFRHACDSKTIILKTPGENLYQLRSVSKIDLGEEIRICFLTDGNGNFNGMWNLAKRQQYLQLAHGFKCDCDLCQIEEQNGDNYRYQLYQNLEDHLKKLGERIREQHVKKDFQREEEYYRRAVSSYREMYKYAKECNSPRGLIITRILMPGHTMATRGFIHCSKITKNSKQADIFRKECNVFAKVGLKLTKITMGNDSTACKGWIDRSGESFDNYVKEMLASKCLGIFQPE